MTDVQEVDSENAALVAYFQNLQQLAFDQLSEREKQALLANPETSGKAHELLADRVIESHFWDQSPADQRKARAALKKQLDTSRAISPFALQDRGNLHLLKYFLETIRRHAPKSPLAKAPTPILATLPIPYFNAISAKHPHYSGQAIVLNDALMTFLFLLAKILARFFPADANKNGVALLFERGRTNALFAADAGRRKLFADLMLALVYDANPLARTTPYLLPLGPTFVANNLLNYAELFVFAHELAHVSLGHHKGSEGSRLKRYDRELVEINVDFEDEYEADAAAFDCLSAVAMSVFAKVPNETERLTHSYWGIDLFFKALELTSNAITLAKFGYEGQIVDGKHPTAAQRRKALHDIVRRRYPGFNSQLGCLNWEVAVYPGDWIGFLIDAMWTELKPEIKAMHDQGVSVSPRWEDLTEVKITRNE